MKDKFFLDYHMYKYEHCGGAPYGVVMNKRAFAQFKKEMSSDICLSHVNNDNFNTLNIFGIYIYFNQSLSDDEILFIAEKDIVF